MGLASTVQHMKTLLDGLNWPQEIQNLPSPPPPLACYITPPNPNVQASVPTAYVWFNRGMESRSNDALRAGTIPRASYTGGPSGTKSTVHTVPVYFVWLGGSPTDPNADTLFPGMVDAIMATLRVAPDAEQVADPWTDMQSSLVDIGERMSYLTDLRALEPMQLERLDALIECTVTEVFRS